MVAYVWNASAGGDWSTAADWTPNGVPAALDTTDFATGGNAYTVTGDGSTSALTVDSDQVTFEGAVTAGAGSASAGLIGVNDALVVLGSTADFMISSLAFDPGTLLQVAGLLIDDAGGSADVIVDSGLDADLTTGSSITLNQLYVNQGATYAGDVTLNDGGSVTLDTSASFGGGTISLLGGGTLYVANATGQSTGSLGLSEAVAVSTSLTLASDPGVMLDMSGLISGAGYLVVDGGAVSLSGTNTFAGPTVVIDAALALTGAAAASTGAVFLDNASLVLQADSQGGVPNEVVVGSGGADTVSAGAGDSFIYAGNATAFTYQGGTGSNEVFGSAAVMVATGGAGSDTIFAGSSGQDTLFGGSGSTTLAAGAGGVLLALGDAAQELVAGGGNTTLAGGYSSGNDVYFASGSGATVVEPGSGVSIVVLSGALNLVQADVGSQTVFLEGGFSTLDFTAGYNSGGTMGVVGFRSADTLHLSGYAADEMQNALSTATVSGGNTILQLSDNEHIVLFGVTGLSAASFT